MIQIADRYSRINKIDKIKDTTADISSYLSESRRRMSEFKPKLGRLSQTKRSSMASNLNRELRASTGAASDTYFSFPFAYDPAVSSVDRMWLPEDRRQQTRYWRTYYATDPLVGNVLDMYSEMPISDFELRGPGVEGEVKRDLEDMCSECDILQTMMFMIREFLVIGEVAPHCFFNKIKGMWTHITIHNPDFLEVYDSPLVDHDPIIELMPDEEMRKILTSGDPRMMELRNRLPKDILTRLIAKMNIPLSNLNVTFIPRKQHPYYIRGTSILSRLFKIFIYEDAIYDASVATARRHAGPLKIVKLGDPATGWLPEPGEEERVAELLAESELDPNAFMIYHYGINFEAFGTTERIMNIGKEWDFIERAKLIGLGISKAFVTGEVTYASAEKGLEVFLSRLLTLRQFFENRWMKQKFFKPIAMINGWYLPTSAEVSHRVRTKRAEGDRRLIIPEIEWKKALRPTIDSDKISTYNTLRDKGLFIAPSTIMSAAGLDFRKEAKQSKDEQKWLEKEGLTPLPGTEGSGMPAGGTPTGGGIPTGGGGIPDQPMSGGLPGVPAEKDVDILKEHEEEKKRKEDFQEKNRHERDDAFLIGDGNKERKDFTKYFHKSAEAEIMENQAEGFGIVSQFDTPVMDDPENYESREDWQKALNNSKIPQDAKRYIKSLENTISDGWENSFESFWKKIEPRYKEMGKMSESEVSIILSDSIADHIKKLNIESIDNDLTGIFHNGKVHAYEALGFIEFKKSKVGFVKSSVTIDSMEDDLVLRSMKDRLKKNLVQLTNEDLKKYVIGKIQESLKEAFVKSSSSEELKNSLKKVYEDSLWKLQRASRVESTNNFVVATLLGFKDQGIKRAKWNAHKDHKTCPKCRGLNGVEFDVDYLLSLGAYPLVATTHHQCRCWITPVIGDIDSWRTEVLLANYRTKFQTPIKVEYPVEKITKDFSIGTKECKNVPTDIERPFKTAYSRIKDSKYSSLWPNKVEFVPDVAEVDEFKKKFGDKKDLRNRVQYWKDASGKFWVSNFYTKDKDPQASTIRLWAENVWPKVAGTWSGLYEEKMKPMRVPDLDVETVDRISDVLSPIPIVIPFRVGVMRGISLNKKFRELGETVARDMLRTAQVRDIDIESIINWRTINPSWTTTGKAVEVGEKDLQQEGFVNETAKRSPKDLFVESISTYVGDGFLLNFRDEQSYEQIKSSIFGGKEFI